MNAPSTPNATTDSDSTPNATTDSEQAFVIWTNLFYTVAGIAILWLGQTMLHAALAIALGLLAGASWHYHDRLTKDSLLLDFVGMPPRKSRRFRVYHWRAEPTKVNFGWRRSRLGGGSGRPLGEGPDG